MDDIFGAWITPEGEIIDVPEPCGHHKIVGYQDANDEGWIGIIHGRAVQHFHEGRYSGMSIRLNPLTVTSRALGTLSRMVAKSVQPDFYFNDAFARSFPGQSYARGGKTKADAQAFIKYIPDHRDELDTFKMGD